MNNMEKIHILRNKPEGAKFYLVEDKIYAIELENSNSLFCYNYETNSWNSSNYNIVDNNLKYINIIDLEKELNIPFEILDLVYFMCETWYLNDQVIHKNLTEELIMQYHKIQGIRLQTSLIKIGSQSYNNKNISKAINWLLN